MAKAGKVLMLVENLPVPPDRRVWPEALTLRDYGFQVSIIGPKGVSEHRESYICIDGIHIYRYRIPIIGHKYFGYVAEYGVALLMTFWLSIKVLFRHGFDVIHTANPPDIFFIIGLFYRIFGKKFVFDQHDLSPELFQVLFKKRANPLYKLMRFLERCSYKTAHLVIVTNASQKRFAIERGHCRADRVFIVRNGPDLRQWKLAIPEPELKRGRPYLLGYVGLMGAQDGVEYTLYALHDLVHKRGRQDVSLVLMGEGAAVAALRILAHKLQLDEYVHFTGWISKEEVLRYLTVADIGLIPDPKNGLNEFSTMIKTMEYMVMSKPIVAFDLAETRFSAQDAALYATPNSIEDFANKIEALLADEAFRLSMGAIGRRRVEETLSWDHTKIDLLLAYEMHFARSHQVLETKHYEDGNYHTDVQRN